MTTTSEVQALVREVTEQPAELFAPEDAPQPRLLRRSDDLCIAHLLSETSGLWTAHERAAHGARIQLYAFLGAVYEHGAAVAQNELALAELRRNVGQLYATARWQRTANNKSAHELLLLATMGVAQPSLRSKYKRVLLEAANANVPPDRESFKIWIRKARGIVDLLAGPVAVPEPCDTQTGGDPQPVPSVRNDAVDGLRRDLLTTTASSLSPISMIGNAPPKDTFAVVVYRVEANRLVPCLWTDSPSDVNALLRGVIRRNHRETPATATGHSGPQHDALVKEAA